MGTHAPVVPLEHHYNGDGTCDRTRVVPSPRGRSPTFPSVNPDTRGASPTLGPRPSSWRLERARRRRRAQPRHLCSETHENLPTPIRPRHARTHDTVRSHGGFDPYDWTGGLGPPILGVGGPVPTSAGTTPTSRLGGKREPTHPRPSSGRTRIRDDASAFGGLDPDVCPRRSRYRVRPRGWDVWASAGLDGDVGDRRDVRTPGPSGADGNPRTFTEEGDGPKRDDIRGETRTMFQSRSGLWYLPSLHSGSVKSTGRVPACDTCHRLGRGQCRVL